MKTNKTRSKMNDIYKNFQQLKTFQIIKINNFY